MDYKDKYEEALSRAKTVLENAYGQETKTACGEIFPELKESEDERIRKAIIHYILYETKGTISEATEHIWVKWLEKQKEQKELPLMNGDADLYFDEWNQQKQNPTKRQCFEEGMRYAERLQKEQKPAEWSEEDEKMLNEVLDSVTYAFYDQGKEGEIEDDPAFLWLHRLRPSWKPSEDEERLTNTSISFLKDFADKGYENAVECIDWLKSKLNGNSGK